MDPRIILSNKVRRLLEGRNISTLSISLEPQVVLCHLSYNEYTPYAVWRYNSEGNTYSGSYFQTYEEADKDFRVKSNNEEYQLRKNA